MKRKLTAREWMLLCVLAVLAVVSGRARGKNTCLYPLPPAG